MLKSYSLCVIGIEAVSFLIQAQWNFTRRTMNVRRQILLQNITAISTTVPRAEEWQVDFSTII